MDNGISLIIMTTMEQSIENLYKLDGRVPVGKALPFGLQHVLAMFVSNIAPIMILAGAIGLDSSVSAVLIQNCMVTPVSVPWCSFIRYGVSVLAFLS